MIALKFLPYVVKQLTRHRLRTFLTLAGVGVAMFLFVAVQAMQRGVSAATEINANDTTLVVYRKDRFCVFTSRMPQRYISDIKKIDGVKSVIPMKVVVSNCRSSLDVITFRGVPVDDFLAVRKNELKILNGSIENWKKRTDAVLLGKTLANRRGLKVGDKFEAAGITAYVAGVIDSDEVQDQNVAYGHLSFIQQSSDGDLGVVTQFNVGVTDSTKLKTVPAQIDAIFKHDQDPTTTRSEKAFVAYAAADMIRLVSFTRYLGWGCIAAVLALVGNAIVLSVQDRVKEHAILQTLGFNTSLIGQMIVIEGIIVGLAGGIIGTFGALGILLWGQFSMSIDGQSIPMQAETTLLLSGMVISVGLGLLAGVVPAFQASRNEIAHCFRAV
ncbi:MAG: ABC transporter permease [Phycisphaerae bacterium]|nr:ABC transporter permease [Phycisphaerae bacterium]